MKNDQTIPHAGILILLSYVVWNDMQSHVRFTIMTFLAASDYRTLNCTGGAGVLVCMCKLPHWIEPCSAEKYLFCSVVLQTACLSGNT